MFNVIDHKTGFKIDFIVRKDNAYRKHEFGRRRRIRVEDIDLWIVSPEDLVISKIIWIQQLKSEKQIEDIENMLAIPSLDMDYIRHWCKELKLTTYNLISSD